MPNHTIDNFRLSGTEHDKRVKLTGADKLIIVQLHKNGAGIRQLSRDFNVSRRTIQFLIYPERLEHNKQLRAERGGSMQYYNKAAHTIAMKAHREHKKKVIDAEIIR